MFLSALLGVFVGGVIAYLIYKLTVGFIRSYRKHRLEKLEEEKRKEEIKKRTKTLITNAKPFVKGIIDTTPAYNMDDIEELSKLGNSLNDDDVLVAEVYENGDVVQLDVSDNVADPVYNIIRNCRGKALVNNVD